ncbi:metallophosphoesterase [Moraxella haemolytica]|uniref:metallophosphoesterase n=1 Tax=Moraxella TaxID=475 RepID=UPI0025434967|nr:metallophosphoesterase [Moraxella sp. ZY171148]WII95317.1 metallophosphoesterase [Moraxella sp. ZY171148]
MRMLFLVVIVILFQLFTFIVGRGLEWLVRPYVAKPRRWITPAFFVVSNVFLAVLFFGQFRLGVGYLAVLWLGVLTVMMVVLASFILRRLSLDGRFSTVIRVFAVLVFGVLVGLSVYNAYTPTVRYLSVQIDKPMAKPVRIGLVSDLHLGSLFGANQLDRLSELLKDERVDLLLMAGDIMDDDTKAYDEQNMAAAFARVVTATTDGVVASLGNHDLYDTDAYLDIVQAIREAGATLLDDKVATIYAGGVPLSIIGRFDDHVLNRQSSDELYGQLSQQQQLQPVILLDHRPSQIDENVKLPIDLQVSGHTHNGQLFPANFIVKMLNRVAYGYRLINGTHIVVSSGYGFWGIPLRLGSQSELWVIELSGK